MVLLVGLVMLVLVTLAAVTSHNLARTSLKVVSNMEFRNDAAAAAQQTIETAISSILFAQQPTQVFGTSAAACGGANSQCFDVNGDGTPDTTVTLTPAPTCLTSRTITSQELNLSDPEDLGCATSVSQSFGLAGTADTPSLCAQSTWEVRAVAEDTATRARVAIRQGLGMRLSSADVSLACPEP